MIADRFITTEDVHRAEQAWKAAEQATEAAWAAVDFAHRHAEEVEASAAAAREHYERLRLQVGFRRPSQAPS